MNPKIAVGYEDVARWLHNFATSHAKREHPRAEVIVDTGGAREGRSHGLRLVLDGRPYPPADRPPMEFGFAEVAEGRTRFAWCESLAQRIRSEVHQLVASEPASTRT
jgi:hypothetical protein